VVNKAIAPLRDISTRLDERASLRRRSRETSPHTMPPLDGFARAQLRMASALARDDTPNKRAANAPKLAAWAGGDALASAARRETNPVPTLSRDQAIANAVRRDASASASASRSPTKMRPNVRFLGNALRAIASSNARLDRETRQAAAASASGALRAGDEERETTTQTAVDEPEHTKLGRGGDGDVDGGGGGASDDADGRWVKNRRRRGKKGGGKRRRREAGDGRERKRPTRDSREEGELSDGD